MKVRMARHILKLKSLNKSNNKSNNNNQKITLTCVFTPVYLEVPTRINRQPPIYTHVLFQKFFYMLGI